MRTHPNEEFYPTEGKAGAIQDFIHTFESTTVRKASTDLFAGVLLLPKLMGMDPIKGEELKQKQKDVSGVLDKLEKFLSAYG